jgi:hypothetical protein
MEIIRQGIVCKCGLNVVCAIGDMAQLGTDHNIKTQQQPRKVFQVYPF